MPSVPGKDVIKDLWGCKDSNGVVHAVLSSASGAGVTTWCHRQYFWWANAVTNTRKRYRDQFVKPVNDSVGCLECLAAVS